jgi:peptide/nickel transport system permease protein
MAEATITMQPETPVEAPRKGSNAFMRVVQYTGVRIISLLLTIVVGVYLTIIIANMGGYVDEMRRGFIQEQVAIAVSLDPELQRLPLDQRRQRMQDMVAIQEQQLGLDQPFLIRSFSYLRDALTLNLGRAEILTSDSGSRQVRLIILERLPATLVLFASAQLILFFMAIIFALSLSRRYGSFIDRAMIAMAPTSAAPAWFYGLFLILIFAAVLGVAPFGGMVSAPPPRDPVAYGLSLMRHLALPVGAIVLSAIFLSIYSWRTFFLIYSSEDYVEMAHAKGLTSGAVERRYILRPTLPTIITDFALTLIALWQGGIVLETIFNWPGLGRLLYQAIGVYDTPIIVGSVVIYAYLLAFTVFLLDIIYALVDPRVKVGEGSRGV